MIRNPRALLVTCLALVLLVPVAWSQGAKLAHPSNRGATLSDSSPLVDEDRSRAAHGILFGDVSLTSDIVKATSLERPVRVQPNVVRQLIDVRPMVNQRPPDAPLEARQPIRKRATAEFARVPSDSTGILIVKFADHARVRFGQGGLLRSEVDVAADVANVFVNALQLEIEPAFLQSTRDLARIQQRAAGLSGRAQPDLAGMYHIKGSAADLVLVAQALNELPGVEFVEFEREMHTGGGGGLQTGACCVPTCTGCVEVVETVCDQLGGTYQGDGTTCAGNCLDPGACCIQIGPSAWACATTANAAECLAIDGYFQGPGTECFDEDGEPLACEDFEIECGACGTGSCMVDNDRTFCDNEDCCAAVCELDPFCCGEDDIISGRGPYRWDAICVQHARQLCQGFFPGAPNPICEAATGPCFGAHPGAGCNQVSCCALVCDANPSCCTSFWSDTCVALAISLCGLDPVSGPTPNFSHLQGYLTPGGYVDELGEIPPEYSFLPVYTDPFGVVRPSPGWGGEGHDLEVFDVLGQFLLDEYGVGNNPDFPGVSTTRGESIRVGVIEHTAFVRWDDPSRTHESIRGKVTGEPGQTPLIVPGSSNLTGDHGTACLGIIGGEVGITGVAPAAQLYFFPIVSVEEGGRLGRAILSALSVFEYGDVLSFSIGPGGGGTLASSERNWLLLRLAADLGVTCLVAAGNSCANVDDNAQFDDEDSDVIIVGAVYPGRDAGNVHCRLPFSNYCNTCEGANRVHTGAWGMMVTTAGYGNLFRGAAADGNTRTYTTTFSGTSAATPIVAGIAARLQSLAKQFYGMPLSPAQIRALIAGNGISQCNAPTRDAVPGHDTPTACPGSWRLDQPPDLIGGGAPGLPNDPPVGFPMLFPAGESLISAEYFGCTPVLQDVDTIRGTYLSGNTFSICSADGIYYKARSQYTQAGSLQPAPVDGVPGVTYVATGQIVDILVTAVSPSAAPAQMSVTALGVIPTGARSVTFLELFDWEQNRWMLGGAAPGTAVEITPFAPARFVHPETLQVLARVWVFAWPAGNSGNGMQPIGGPTFDYWLDAFLFGFTPIVQPQ